jgi:Fe-S oxidoreductase
MPAFARKTFKTWFRERKRNRDDSHKPTVVLWPDTFNNYFFPHTAKAAVEVLESAGYHVEVPQRSLCCGRPLYDYGFLDQAKTNLNQILETLRPYIRTGVPVVVLEPSCASVFRDELINILAKEEDGKRLAGQTKSLGEFLNAVHHKPPAMKGKALLHGHCHQKALWGVSHEQQLLEGMGIRTDLLDDGCCGLAGSFGFEADHYDVSMKIGERVLLPKVRTAPRDTLIVSDGFSCREQIEHGTRRRGMHLAEVIHMALHQPLPAPKRYVESGWVQEEPSYPVLTAATAGLLVAAGIALWNQLRTRE